MRASPGGPSDTRAKARQALSGGVADSLVKTSVDDQFEDIRDLRAAAAGPAPIDNLIQQLNEYYQYLFAAKIALEFGPGAPAC